MKSCGGESSDRRCPLHVLLVSAMVHAVTSMVHGMKLQKLYLVTSTIRQTASASHVPYICMCKKKSAKFDQMQF